MRAVQVAENAVSIWFSEENVPTRRQMLALVRQALEERGFPPWPETEAECFTMGQEALVIARPGRPHRLGFFFPDLELLLAGALACGPGESSLYLDGGGYVLTVPSEGISPALYEFGQYQACTPEWEAHAREQGLCLLEDTAISDLRRYFAT